MYAVSTALPIGIRKQKEPTRMTFKKKQQNAAEIETFKGYRAEVTEK